MHIFSTNLKRVFRLFNIAVCLVGTTAAMGASSCNDTRLVPLTILHINDFHYALKPHHSQPHGLGGAARLKTLIDRRKAAAGSDPVLTLDAGDYSEGNAYFAFDQGRGALEVLKEIGVDATVLGNHDFMAGPQVLNDVLLDSANRPPVLAANLEYSSFSQGRALEEKLPPYKIFRYGSLAVGVIGVTTFEFTYASYMEPVKIIDPVPVVTQIAQSMHERGVQAIILLSHNSFSFNKNLARQIPWVTAVVSGHSHVKTPQPEFVINAGRRVPVVEAGQWGRFLGELKLDIRPSDGTVYFKNYSLLPVTPDLPQNTRVAALVHRIETDTGAMLSQQGRGNAFTDVIAHSERRLLHNETRENILGNLLTEAYWQGTQADLALEVGSIVGMGQGAGPITTADAFNLQPHVYNPDTRKAWTIKLLTISGHELINIFNLWLGISSLDVPFAGILSVAGAEVHYDPTSGLNPVRRLFIGADVINPARDYTVALHDGVLLILNLANNRLNLGFNLSRIQDTGKEAWIAVRDLLSLQGTLDAGRYNSGQKFKITTADLATDESDNMVTNNPDGSMRLGFRVRNVGLEPAPAGARLTVKFAMQYNVVNEDTAAETLANFGTPRTLPALAPGASTVVYFDWPTPHRVPARDVLFSVAIDNAAFDKNSKNNNYRFYVSTAQQ